MIRHDAFRAVPLLRARDFVSYCKARNVRIEWERLRQFERIGVFAPILRVYRPDVTVKIETVEGGYRYRGTLGPDEQWDGETRIEQAVFEATAKTAASWATEGLLWVPGQGEWEHQATIDSEAARHEAYYSVFQLHALEWVRSAFTLNVELEWAMAADGAPVPDWNPKLSGNAAQLAQRQADALRAPRQADIVAVLLQLIANRFYYQTRTDGRQIRIGQFHDWKWESYARKWTAAPFVRALGLTEEESRNWYETLDLAWMNADPLFNWFPLARFVRLDKRDRLKGDALRGVALREMAHMLRMFHEKAFATPLQPLGEVGVTVIERIPDVDPDREPLRALELMTNDFGVNAKPLLVLFVEGATEQAALPLLFERLWGMPPERCGIEIVNLGGVDNAAGGKEAPFSALWRLVDYLHHHQTLAFILLDNEGLAARNVQTGLPKAVSVHSSERKATRRDLIKVWRTSFEMENFSDTELAVGMNRLGGDQRITNVEVAECRRAARERKRGERLQTIDKVFERAFGAPLDKPALAQILVDIILDPAARRKIDNRPITKLLERLARKATMNFQPVTHGIWEQNQRSGYVGELQPAALRRRRRTQAARRRSRDRALKNH